METVTSDAFAAMPPFDDSPNDLIGKTISHYKILRKLGGGGIGVVYLAEDIHLPGRQVAIKFLRDEYANDPNLNERFKLEAKVLLELVHRNIVRFFDFAKGQIAGGQEKFFIVMEYVKGGSLREKLTAQKSDLSIQQAFEIIISVCEGLRAAHEKDITHRDIKPENILIDKEGTIKISDFGLAKLKGGSLVSLSGVPKGTPAYMSPEQTEAKELDQRSDIFSLGVVLYELITRHQPFTGDSLKKLFAVIRHKKPNPLAQHRKDIPEGLQKIVDKALAKSPRRRYQNIDKLLEDLKSLLAQKHEEEKNWRAIAQYLIPIIVVIAGVIGFIVDATELFDRAKNFFNQTSAVSILTEPAGATVFFGGDSIGITPVMDYSSKRGDLAVRIKKPGYQTFDTSITVNKGANPPFSLELKKVNFSSPDLAKARVFSERTGATARVSIKANIAEAKFLLDGKLTPRTRLVDMTLPVGLHRIEISAEGYTSIKGSFRLSQGFNKELTYTLKKIVAPLPPQSTEGSIGSASEPRVREQTPPIDTKPEARLGSLKVLVRPFGSIYIDGKPQYIDGNPQKKDWDRQFETELQDGAYVLRAEHPQFGTWEKKITIEAEKPLGLIIDFEKKIKLTVTSTPVLGEIFVDDEYKGSAPKVLTLPAGKHRIEVRLTGYVSPPQVINLEEDIKTPLQFVLKKIE